ncbi:MAG: hypothetical protein LUE31_06395 [Lachnospiraceae bacterium]|nr:hypothetical protein [Lachnospiraceae bacterium]
MLLQSPSFESALLHISKYIPLAKIVNNEQAELKVRMESSTDGNYPYSGELHQQARADEREMLVEEYLIDKACKNLIQELAQKSSIPEI